MSCKFSWPYTEVHYILAAIYANKLYVYQYILVVAMWPLCKRFPACQFTVHQSSFNNAATQLSRIAAIAHKATETITDCRSHGKRGNFELQPLQLGEQSSYDSLQCTMRKPQANCSPLSAQHKFTQCWELVNKFNSKL